MSQNRRTVKDRRIHRTPPLSRYTFIGRRKKSRRKNETTDYYVDRYEYKYFFLVLSILILCTLDAIFTLNLLKYGGEELNPFMLLLINKGTFIFLIVKISITTICLIVLLLHKNFKIFGRFKINKAIYAVFISYFILILYEAYLNITNSSLPFF